MKKELTTVNYYYTKKTKVTAKYIDLYAVKHKLCGIFNINIMNVVENKALIKTLLIIRKEKNYEECFEESFEESKESYFMVCE